MAVKINTNRDTEVIDFCYVEEDDIVVLKDGKFARLRHIVKTPVEVKIPRTQYLTTFDLLNKDGVPTGDHRTISLLDTSNINILERRAPTLLGRVWQWVQGKRFD